MQVVTGVHSDCWGSRTYYLESFLDHELLHLHFLHFLNAIPHSDYAPARCEVPNRMRNSAGQNRLKCVCLDLSKSERWHLCTTLYCPNVLALGLRPVMTELTPNDLNLRHPQRLAPRTPGSRNWHGYGNQQ